MKVLSHRIEISREELEFSNNDIEKHYKNHLIMQIAEKIADISIETHKGPGGNVLEIRQILISQGDFVRLLREERLAGMKQAINPKKREILTNQGTVTINGFYDNEHR